MQHNRARRGRTSIAYFHVNINKDSILSRPDTLARRIEGENTSKLSKLVVEEKSSQQKELGNSQK